ncbi:unnamed protein product [Bursaphelenchus okinawaensis]|uniref:Uncharacterized protein n=1 Tax=Bursaphelenchus okinawaensis TaxID=465554 RepID=A0A811L710_9BILA|nr:unnamed protein product [Bursaphelenchus okinawaensis]CAG9119584.1 unnamed protein product [Bursaphelenchus okinawaensis]
MNWVKLLLLSLFIWVVDSKKQCEPITIPLCKGIGYNMTSYPNSYGHEKQDEAGLEVHQFYPLVEVNCYKHLKFFLCALYTPICQENYDMSIMPCQEVCREARKKCSPLMNNYGFQWPETLNCDRLPRFADQQKTGVICAAPPDATKNSKSSEVKEVETPKAPKRPTSVATSDSRCSCQCGRPFNPVSAETVNYYGKGYSIQNVSNCAYSCSGLLPTHEASQTNQYKQWVLFITLTCLCISFLTVITFSIDLGRFQYPERPILFLVLCQMCVAIGYTIQFMNGDKKIGCDADMLRTMMTPEATVGSSIQWTCLTTFGLTYYFSMAAAVWWVVLALSWVLAAVPHWSTEWIGKYSCYFHTFAWILPAIQTGFVYMFNAIDGDPISGVCFVGNTNRDHLLYFVIIPMILYFVAGVSFLFVGLQYLWSLRSNLQKAHHKTSKFSQLMSKIVVFALIYTLSVILHVMVLIYEYLNRPKWEQSLLCPCSQETPVNAETLQFLNLLKVGSMMAIGWTSMIWVFSSKTFQSWKRFFCCGATPYATYSGPKLPFDLVASQYQQIPPPPPPLPHPQFPPLSHKQFHSPEFIYAKRDLISSPHFSAANTLRHCPRDV